MKTILLLGGFGFIGTNILKYSEQLGSKYKIIVFDRFNKHLAGIEFPNLEKVYSGDFSDEYLIEKIFKENQIDIVLHSISASVPSTSIDNIFDLQFNVIPTIKLLDLMCRYKVLNLVFISSGGAVYGDLSNESTGHVEENILYPKSAYGISKLTIEKFLHLYSQLYGINSLVLRLSNPYGPYHFSDKQGVINIAVKKAINNVEFEIWGTGKGRKDYIYVEDFCRIFFKLIDKDLPSYTVLNIGSGERLSVENILQSIKESYVPDFTWKMKSVNNLDVTSFKLNIDKLMAILGDFSFVSFEEGLKLTYQWYNNWINKSK